jgi:hypothetical protein
MKGMKAGSILLTSALVTLLPSVALACPGMGGAGYGCALGSLGGYIAAVAIGLLVGIGSVALERSPRKR